jgi:hypothetical protein
MKSLVFMNSGEIPFPESETVKVTIVFSSSCFEAAEEMLRASSLIFMNPTVVYFSALPQLIKWILIK